MTPFTGPSLGDDPDRTTALPEGAAARLALRRRALAEPATPTLDDVVHAAAAGDVRIEVLSQPADLERLAARSTSQRGGAPADDPTPADPFAVASEDDPATADFDDRTEMWLGRDVDDAPLGATPTICRSPAEVSAALADCLQRAGLELMEANSAAVRGVLRPGSPRARALGVRVPRRPRWPWRRRAIGPVDLHDPLAVSIRLHAVSDGTQLEIHGRGVAVSELVEAAVCEASVAS